MIAVEELIEIGEGESQSPEKLRRTMEGVTHRLQLLLLQGSSHQFSFIEI